MDNKTHLISFKDGSYKKIKPVEWKHSQWIHYITDKGHTVRINPTNVNYIEEIPESEFPVGGDNSVLPAAISTGWAADLDKWKTELY